MKTFEKNTNPQSNEGANRNNTNTPASNITNSEKTTQPMKQPSEIEKKPSVNPDHTSPEKKETAPVAGNETGFSNERNANATNEGKGKNTGNSQFKPGFTDFTSEGKDRSSNQDVERGNINPQNTTNQDIDKNSKDESEGV